MPTIADDDKKSGDRKLEAQTKRSALSDAFVNGSIRKL